LWAGPGESGKSTIFKQMKILQIDGGFKPEELQAFKALVYKNCVSEMKVLASAAYKLEISMAHPTTQVRHFNSHTCFFLIHTHNLPGCYNTIATPSCPNPPSDDLAAPH
jgi:hypothetical protein